MRLSAPKKWVFWASAILVALGLVGKFVNVPLLKDFSYWFVVVGYVLLAAGAYLRGF